MAYLVVDGVDAGESVVLEDLLSPRFYTVGLRFPSLENQVIFFLPFVCRF